MATNAEVLLIVSAVIRKRAIKCAVCRAIAIKCAVFLFDRKKPFETLLVSAVIRKRAIKCASCVGPAVLSLLQLSKDTAHVIITALANNLFMSPFEIRTCCCCFWGLWYWHLKEGKPHHFWCTYLML